MEVVVPRVGFLFRRAFRRARSWAPRRVWDTGMVVRVMWFLVTIGIMPKRHWMCMCACPLILTATEMFVDIRIDIEIQMKIGG
jgi:hypothetical protein